MKTSAGAMADARLDERLFLLGRLEPNDPASLPACPWTRSMLALPNRQPSGSMANLGELVVREPVFAHRFLYRERPRWLDANLERLRCHDSPIVAPQCGATLCASPFRGGSQRWPSGGFTPYTPARPRCAGVSTFVQSDADEIESFKSIEILLVPGVPRFHPSMIVVRAGSGSAASTSTLSLMYPAAAFSNSNRVPAISPRVNRRVRSTPSARKRQAKRTRAKGQASTRQKLSHARSRSRSSGDWAHTRGNCRDIGAPSAIFSFYRHAERTH